ncbi:putative polyvalent protein kinase domain-containing protein [Lacihabitans lacunae]|uniref:Uncharacterized protein n=1 Tax=Lacihabitans lacunae TaxID=1028214 RepID=A0ABV7Z1S4_9BACT
MKNELQNIISGKSSVVYGALIQTVARELERSCNASKLDKENEHFKKQETEILVELIDKEQLWISDLNLDNYVSKGAEQRVYLKDGKTVQKLNDSIYYASWQDYFHNLLLNNFFFADTAYRLDGFYKDADVVFAVVSQSFIKATEPTKLENLLTENGVLRFIDTVFYLDKTFWN